MLASYIILIFTPAIFGYITHRTPPKWPERYYVEGILSLPYAELYEPFNAWYDGVSKRSRVDLYAGTTKTIQRGDKGSYGQHFMIAPMSNEEVLNQITCFQLNGTANAVVGPQHMLPDMTNFSYIGVAADVDVWQLKNHAGGKYNTYTLYISKQTYVPVYYEMYGYDSLLGSHYDDYKLTYKVYAENFPDDVFDTPMAGKECTGFPGPGYEARIIANPMQEFVYPIDDTHLHPMFKDFTEKFSKEFNPDKKHVFKHNLRYINSMNRRKLSFTLKVNHLADHSPSDLRKLRGRKTTVGMKGKSNNGKPFVTKLTVNDVPTELNWRLYGAVTPVKDQAVCGSCWSFGTTGTIEGTLFLKTKRLIRLSQQNLMDCSWGFGNNGCDGGEEFRSYEYMMKHGGIFTEESYGPYRAIDGFCHKGKVGANITGYVNVTSGDLNALKIAIAQRGPVAVGIDAAHLSLVFYSHGVYYEPECGNTPDRLDHAVLAVGYGVQNGQAYWLIKNSWSTHWGNDGYVLMSQKDNNCGVATDATYVLMD